MRKFLTALLIAVTLLSATFLHADALPQNASETKHDIILCYSGDVYSADFVFDVIGEGGITDVKLEIDGCHYDWNYVANEARLYVSLASANAIKKSITVATVTSYKAVILERVSAVVNGNIKTDIYSEHTPMDIPAVPPTCDKTGLDIGKECSNCKVILEAQPIVPATGPVVSASLLTDGTLTVKGALTDNKTTSGVTILAVYSTSGRMLHSKNITSLDQSDFEVHFDGCEDFGIAKIFRWGAADMDPCQAVVEIKLAQTQ